MNDQGSLAADVVAGYVQALGVRDVFGVGGANVEDLFAAVQRRRPRLRLVMCKHEHGAGCAADAYARCTGGFGVVMVTSGGAAMNLVPSLAESFASRIPVLAIVGEPPSSLHGHGAFQDMSGGGGALDALQLYRQVSRFSARVEAAELLPELLVSATRSALAGPCGPAVLLLAKDHQTTRLDADPMPPPAEQALPATDWSALTSALRGKRVVVVLGPEVALAGAQARVAELVRHLEARVVCTPDARDSFDNRDPHFAGVLGTMAQPLVATIAEQAELWMVIGSRLPLLARQGFEPYLQRGSLLCINPEPPHLPGGTFVEVPRARLGVALTHLCQALPAKNASPATGLWSTALHAPACSQLSLQDLDENAPLRTAQALKVLEEGLPPKGTVLVDAGNTGAHSVHYLRIPSEARWLIAMGMAGLGYSFGASIGAACATGERCTVLAGDGAFYMHGWEIHTAVQYSIPVTFVLFNNRAHGMCFVREHLLLGVTSDYNTFKKSHLGAALAAAFPGLPARDCSTLAQVQRALRWAQSKTGPVVIGIELDGVEVPPFRAFQHGSDQGPFRLEQGVT